MNSKQHTRFIYVIFYHLHPTATKRTCPRNPPSWQCLVRLRSPCVQKLALSVNRQITSLSKSNDEVTSTFPLATSLSRSDANNKYVNGSGEDKDDDDKSVAAPIFAVDSSQGM
jgi:hypothetical protein